MKRAILITVNNETLPYPIYETEDMLKQMQAAVGGLIQDVPHNLDEDITFYCNEEAYALSEDQQQRNDIASDICSLGFDGNYEIVGPVLVLGGVDNEGETLGLSVEQTELFLGPKDNLLDAFSIRR